MTSQFVMIDGAQGEGGGQVLRSSLALSICLKKPFKIDNIRAKRKKSGLLRQHLTAVQAAARISHARVVGDQLGSQSLTFEPQGVQSGEYHFAIGSAGSTTLVLQTILLPLLYADGVSKVRIEGGTHNPMAPPFDFLEQAFLPILQRMGASVDIRLIRPGFFPGGGGCIEVETQPVSQFTSVNIRERGKLVEKTATVLLANLPGHIAEREVKTLQRKLSWPSHCFHIQENGTAYGPGNVISVKLKSNSVTEVFTGFGARGVSAEKLATQVVKEVHRYLTSDTAVDEHLADQLLLPMALAKGGSFITGSLSQHTVTNIDVIKTFFDIHFRVEKVSPSINKVSVVENGNIRS